METSILMASLLTIAAANPNGYTVDSKTLKPITKGYAVAVAETQNSFGAEGLKSVIAYVKTHKEVKAFGGWFNSQVGKFQFDATIICESREAAEAIARLNNQLAFYDLETDQEIWI